MTFVGVSPLVSRRTKFNDTRLSKGLTCNFAHCSLPEGPISSTTEFIRASCPLLKTILHILHIYEIRYDQLCCKPLYLHLSRCPKLGRIWISLNMKLGLPGFLEIMIKHACSLKMDVKNDPIQGCSTLRSNVFSCIFDEICNTPSYVDGCRQN